MQSRGRIRAGSDQAIRGGRTGVRCARSLLLIGHGSASDPRSGAPVRAVAARLRRAGEFLEIASAFWNEGPAMRDVLEGLTSPEVFIVPMFLADGYYTRQVVPRELGLERRVTRRSSQWIHYCRPVGSHPGMADVAAERALATLAARVLPAAAADLVLAGHGTDRSATSSGTVRDIAHVLRRRKLFAAVRFGLLDEDPRIEDVVRAAASSCVVVVPYLLADGWHTRQTLPERLESAAAHRSSAGSTILLSTRPVGTSSRLDSMVLDLVRSAANRRTLPMTQCDELDTLCGA